MGLVGRAMVLLIVIASFQLIHGAVYKVGDSAGWTTIGNIDYKQWAATKTFRVGDVIIFEYNAQFHNVMRVTHPMYKTCNVSDPIATYTTGNDSFTITNHGHHYYLCGVPGHCQAGQKVDINVLRNTNLAPAPSPSFPLAAAPGPSKSNATPLEALKSPFNKLGFAIAILVSLLTFA